MRTAIIAALPRELAGLTQGWKRIEDSDAHVALFEHAANVAVCAGMGCDRVSKAVAVALGCGGIERLVSVGLAGACAETIEAGQVLTFRTVIDVRSGERFVADGEGAVLATAPGLASVAEKRRLYESYGAMAVDMEAACVARLARAHELSFAAMKAISDDANFSMDGLDQFATPEGQFRELAFAWHTALRPRRWRGAVQLGRNSAAALRALTRAVRDELEGQQEKVQ